MLPTARWGLQYVFEDIDLGILLTNVCSLSSKTFYSTFGILWRWPTHGCRIFLCSLVWNACDKCRFIYNNLR